MRARPVAPIVFIGALAAVVGLAHCDGPNPAASPGDEAGIDATTDDAAHDSAFGFGDTAPRETGPPPLDAGDPPARACREIADAATDAADASDADAGDGGACPLPPSVCADLYWLVYYTGGDCVGGECRWEKQFVRCPDGCYGGSCRIPITR